MVEFALFGVGAITIFILWLTGEAQDDEIVRLDMKSEDMRQQIDALRDAHLAKVKEFTSSLKSQHTINDIFIQLLRDKTFVVVDEAPRRVRRKTKRRKR